MHLHAHLKACILDYGPLCSFWLYSFKQFNGMLGSCSTNNRPVQIQIMRHFFQKQDIGDTLLPEQYRHIFQPILDKIRKDQLGTLEEQIPLPISLLELSVGPYQRCLDWVSLEAYTISPPRVIDKLHNAYAEFLKEVYETILPPGTVIEGVTEMFERNSTIGYSGVRLGSHDSRLDRSSFILASWCGNDGSNIQMDSFDLRPGAIDYFLHQSVLVNGKYQSFYMARVRWFQRHPFRNRLGKPKWSLVPEPTWNGGTCIIYSTTKNPQSICCCLWYNW